MRGLRFPRYHSSWPYRFAPRSAQHVAAADPRTISILSIQSSEWNARRSLVSIPTGRPAAVWWVGNEMAGLLAERGKVISALYPELEELVKEYGDKRKTKVSVSADGRRLFVACGSSGSTGAERSSAWICDFSSTERTTAWAGGST